MLTNFERKSFAWDVVAQHSVYTGSEEEEPETQIIDLLTNVFHLIDSQGFNREELMNMADSHFLSEKEEDEEGMKFIITEDGHKKTNCPLCDGEEHIKVIEDDGKCLTCSNDEKVEYYENLEMILHELNNNRKSSNEELVKKLFDNTPFRLFDLQKLIKLERENFLGSIYHFHSTEHELEIIEKYLPREEK